MRTTINIDEAILREAKKRGAEEGKSLTAVVEEALRVYLSRSTPRGKPFRLRLLTKKGRVVPGVNFADRDALYEFMDGRA
jgi:hypothetical protein